MKEQKESVFARTKSVIYTALVLVIALGLGLLIGAIFLGGRKKEPELTAEGIKARIEQVSELATAEMTYRGLVAFREGEIPLINQKSFHMLYDATIRAGIDVSKVQCDVTEEKVTLTLPHAEILGDVAVNPDSLRFYDERNSLFNSKDYEDVQWALAKAQEETERGADVEGLREEAEVNAKALITALMGPELIGERELEIRTEK